MKRPLAIFCLGILAVVGAYLLLRPPEYKDFTKWEGNLCEIIGQVDRIEIKNNYGKTQSIIYLKQISYVQKFQKNQSLNYFNETDYSKTNYNKTSYGKIDQSSVPEGVMCYVKDGVQDPPQIGAFVLISGRFETFRQATNPGEFDARQYYRILGLEAKMSDAVIHGSSKGFNYLKEFQYRLRRGMEEKIENCYPPKEAGILITMLLGNKGNLDNDIEKLYRMAGILHILSVSGLHVSILGYGLHRVLCKLGTPVRIAALIAVLWMWFYGGMIGAGVSAFRAIVMFTIRMFAKWCGRTYDLLTSLAMAAVLLIGSEPLYFYHSGFWLSFTCVLAIGVLYPKLKIKEKAEFVRETEGRFGLKFRVLGLENMGIRLINSWLVSFSVTVMTLPVLLWFYYEVSLWGLLWNLVIVPLVSIVMGGGILNVLLPVWVQKVSLLIARGNCVLLGFFELLCRFTEWTGWGNLILGKPEVWQMLLFVIGVIGFLAFADKWKYYLRLAALTGLVCLMLIRPPKDFMLTFLDVGQGDGICLQNSNGNVYLIDGGSSDKKSVGTYQILPFLKHEGIRNIEAVFLTHGDEDHVSGIKELLEMQKGGVRIKRVVLPDLAVKEMKEEFGDIIALCRRVGTNVHIMKRGQVITDDKLRLTCMHPPENYNGESNASSQVLYMTWQEISALFTGDVEGEGERMLTQILQEQKIEAVTVLKVAHHGSRYSTGDEFLSQITPQVAVISCGKSNSYGHPHEDTLSRLDVCGSKSFTTPEFGAIIIEVNEKIRLHTYLKK